MKTESALESALENLQMLAAKMNPEGDEQVTIAIDALLWVLNKKEEEPYLDWLSSDGSIADDSLIPDDEY